ncbi:MAG: TlpA disulfide reductase family protein [Myxococcota bacterium]|nr:TlpA disulfide reductase family protein [Myxococcota bacterium]
MKNGLPNFVHPVIESTPGARASFATVEFVPMRMPSLFATLLLSVLLPLGSAVADEAALEKASDFTLPSLDGSNVSLSDYLGKKVILVNFWATWCDPCLKEMPELNKMQEELGDSGLQVISISVDDAKDHSKVKALIKRWRYSPVVLLDAETRVVNTFNPRKDMPWTMVIGKDKMIHHKKKGFTSGDEKKLKEWVQALMGG